MPAMSIRDCKYMSVHYLITLEIKSYGPPVSVSKQTLRPYTEVNAMKLYFLKCIYMEMKTCLLNKHEVHLHFQVKRNIYITANLQEATQKIFCNDWLYRVQTGHRKSFLFFLIQDFPPHIVSTTFFKKTQQKISHWTIKTQTSRFFFFSNIYWTQHHISFYTAKLLVSN